ncbi:MAG: hypothetical protein CL912_18915 [Deltaproteobacteria bacterium]|nr:hypothetical protein [Deltaproteobacteria bacterium]|tara:strand:- start:1369 stop:1710 length:342 start_codon:yes stop_codon:yes gene_type:complete
MADYCTQAVKLLGFTDRLTDICQGLRVKELQTAKYFRQLLVARVFFGEQFHSLDSFLVHHTDSIIANSTSFVTPLATLTLFVILASSTEEELTTAKAYTTLSLTSLTFPSILS